MSTFARVDSTGTCAELLVADTLPPFAPGLVWVDITSVSPQPGEGWAYTGGVWAPPAVTQPPVAVLTAQAHDAAFDYVDQYFDSSGLVRMSIWLASPATPPAGQAVLAAILAWADGVWAQYLGVYKPQIAAGGNPAIDYSPAGPPPYTFTQAVGACTSPP